MNLLGTSEMSFSEKVENPLTLSTSGISDLIRDKLDKMFTGIDFKVHTLSDEKIRVIWTDGPAKEELASEISVFTSSRLLWVFRDGTVIRADASNLRYDSFTDYPDKKLIARPSFFRIEYKRYLSRDTIEYLADILAEQESVRPDLGYLNKRKSVDKSDSGYEEYSVGRNVDIFKHVITGFEYKPRWEYYGRDYNYSASRIRELSNLFEAYKNQWTRILKDYSEDNETPICLLFEPIKAKPEFLA